MQKDVNFPWSFYLHVPVVWSVCLTNLIPEAFYRAVLFTTKLRPDNRLYDELFNSTTFIIKFRKLSTIDNVLGAHSPSVKRIYFLDGAHLSSPAYLGLHGRPGGDQRVTSDWFSVIKVFPCFSH